MNDYMKFIHTSRYARWVEKEGRRETWEETVNRYMTNVVAPKLGVDDPYYTKIKDAITNLEIMPSMRAMMTAGPALDRDNTCGYNCFSGEQKIITEFGLQRFDKLQIGQPVTVLAGDGQWRKATVNEFGTQPVNKVTLRHSRKSGVRTEIKVTPDHRWITENRGEVTDLKVGDTVRSNAPEKEFDFILDAWLSGFGFGDGTISARGNAQVRLCGNKNNYLHLFEEFGNCSIYYPPSSYGDATVIFHKGNLS